MSYDKEVIKRVHSRMLEMMIDIDQICRNNNIKYWLDAGTLLGAVRHKGFIPWDDDLDIGMLREDFNKFLKIAPKHLAENSTLQHNSIEPAFYNIACPMKVRDKNSMLLEYFETGEEEYSKGIFVDIFAYDYLPNNSYKRGVLKYAAKKVMKAKRELIAKKKKKSSKSFLSNMFAKFVGLNGLNRLENKITKIATQKTENTLGYGLDSMYTDEYKLEDFFPLIEIEFEGKMFFAPKDPNYFLTKSFGDYMKPPKPSQQKPAHIDQIFFDVN